MYLFFDTETSDLPQDFGAPETDVQNWPHIIQIAWTTGNSAAAILSSECHLIKPNGFKIAPGAFDVHGISTQHATANGVSLRPVLRSFLDAVDSATTIVAHNIEFDTNMIGAECARIGIPNPLRRKELRCTMKESIEHCRIPSRRGLKWPTLTELHSKLFRKEFADAHDASSDCVACMNCFFKLQELNVM